MQPWEWKDHYLLNLIYKELQLLEEQNDEKKNKKTTTTTAAAAHS